MRHFKSKLLSPPALHSTPTATLPISEDVGMPLPDEGSPLFFLPDSWVTQRPHPLRPALLTDCAINSPIAFAVVVWAWLHRGDPHMCTVSKLFSYEGRAWKWVRVIECN